MHSTLKKTERTPGRTQPSVDGECQTHGRDAPYRCITCDDVDLCDVCAHREHRGHTLCKTTALPRGFASTVPCEQERDCRASTRNDDGSNTADTTVPPVPAYRSKSNNTFQTPTRTRSGDPDRIVFNIGGTAGQKIYGLAVDSDGAIVTTGRMTKGCSFITVFNDKGTVVRREEFKKTTRSRWPTNRQCALLRGGKVATICQSNQIGIYDIEHGFITNRDIHEIFQIWRENRFLSCVSYDVARGEIYVGTKFAGGNSRDVLVFDDELNYLRTLLLPEHIRFVADLSVHEDHIIVCDSRARIAHLFSKSHDFDTYSISLPRPSHRYGSWGPKRVCMDSNGTIYVLWGANVASKIHKVIVQYGMPVLNCVRASATKPVDEDVFAICSCVGEGGQERLFAATVESGTLYSYNIPFCY